MIRPELIAGKIETRWLERAAATNPDYSAARINELLWFLQWRSDREGGLPGLVEELIAGFPAQFGNEAMVRIGIPKGDKYTLAECLTIWTCPKSELLGSQEQYYEDLARDVDAAMANGFGDPRPPETFEDFLRMLDPKITVDDARRGKNCDCKEIDKASEQYNHKFLSTLNHTLARQRLAKYLEAVCTCKATQLNGQSYCPALVKLLFDHMEQHRAAAAQAIAETQVTRLIFRELEFALTQKVPVRVVGDSRIGKTSPASVFCKMRPGRARLVTVPETNRMSDFIEAHADALGIEHTPGMSVKKLTNLVKSVLKASGLMVIYDEASFLIPANYTRLTPPSRLEFVRFNVTDRDLPCAMFATPQSYKQTLDQYVKTTGYRIEQWLGRLAPVVILPADLSKEDLMAVAAKHFPAMPVPFLKLICAKAMLTEGYIKNMEFAAKRALFIASENNRTQPTVEDVRQAIEEMMPGAFKLAAPAKTSETPARRKAAALPRETAPALDDDESIPSQPRQIAVAAGELTAY